MVAKVVSLRLAWERAAVGVVIAGPRRDSVAKLNLEQRMAIMDDGIAPIDLIGGLPGMPPNQLLHSCNVCCRIDPGQRGDLVLQ